MLRRHHSILASLVVIGIVVTVAACAQPSPPEQVKVTVGRGAPSMVDMAINIAEAKNYLKEEGLEVDLQTVAGTAYIQAVNAGTLDFGLAPGTTFVNAVAGGNDLVAVLSIMDSIVQEVTVRNDVMQRKGLNPKMTPKQKVEGLKGLKIGVTTVAGTPAVHLRWLLKSEGLDPEKDVEIIATGGLNELEVALREGKVDAGVSSPPRGPLAEVEGYGTVFISGAGGDIPATKGQPGQVVAVSRNLVEKNPKAVEKVARALARAANFAIDNPAEAQKILASEFKIDQKALERTVNLLVQAVPRDGKMTESGWKKLVDYSMGSGIVKQPIDTTEGKYWTNKFLTNIKK